MGWVVINRGSLIDVLPTHDAKEHLVGDECWCNPLIERHELTIPMVSHNESGEAKENKWRDVSYATNLFMLKNGFKWQDEKWVKHDQDKAKPYIVDQLTAEFFVGTLTNTNLTEKK